MVRDTSIIKIYDEIDNILDKKIQSSIKPGEPQAYKKMQAAMEMEINVDEMAAELWEYLRTHQIEHAEHISKDGDDFKNFIEVYKGLALTSEEKQWVLDIRRLFEASVRLSAEIIKIDKDIGIDRDNFVQLRREMDSILDDEIQPLSNKYLVSADENAGKSIDVANYVSLTLLILGIVIGGGAAVLITRSITGPLIMVVDRVSEIAGAAGDLTATIPVTTKDEVGDLANAFNKMLGGLKDMVIRISGTSEEVSASSQQLSSSAQQTNASVQQVSSTIQQLAKGAQIQAQSVRETTGIMEQLNTSISQSAQSTQGAAAASAQASQTAKKGAETVTEAVSTMDKIFDSTASTSEAIKKLSQRSEQMTEIVEVISNVADQTNLLALNAAIEAARAGEAGRGFAVVAEEIRKLAEGSAKSASEIGKLIKEPTKDIDVTVENMDASTKEVTSGKELITIAGAALKEIMQSSENVSAMLQQISAASQQMSSGAKQVVKSVEDVANIAEESSSSTQQASASAQQMIATMQEMSASAQSLAQMGIELNKLVAEFKTGEEQRIARPAPRASRGRAVPSAKPIAERLAEAKEKMSKT